MNDIEGGHFMRLLFSFIVAICIFSLNVGCSVETEQRSEQLFESEQINLALYGATIPEQYDSKIGLVYRLRVGSL
jgi:hypothetical protein